MSCISTEPSWRWDRGQPAVPTLWFDQPGRNQNVIHPAALEELDSHLAEAENDGGIRGLLIRSAKPAGFSAGLDLGTIISSDKPQLESFVSRGMEVFHHLASLSFPTTAVIHGACLGAGLDLALACGRRVALASPVPLQIGTPEVELGLIPAWGSIGRLPRLMGPSEGIDLLISGRSIGYVLARSHHIVDRLAAEADAQDAGNLLDASPAAERTWPKESWETAWNHAHTQIAEQPGEFPEAQLQILTILSIDLAHGEEAAQQAIPDALAELATNEHTRDVIAYLLRESQNHPRG
jgi:3-hydroxyacyl-CoA dehydrogenase/enoyl-CoA hydratase/3-hydroxybutyryl-CoA epimerase